MFSRSKDFDIDGETLDGIEGNAEFFAPENTELGYTEVDNFDEIVNDLDFSDFRGNFKTGYSKVKRKITSKRKITKVPNKPLSNHIPINQSSTIIGASERKMTKVYIPKDRDVIVEGVNKFILSNSEKDNSLKNIGYWNGKKLQVMTLVFNNDSALDFVLSLFNPSMPLDYVFSTSLNLNDKIEVGGGAVSYSDILFNILANPIAIRNCKFIIAGPQSQSQINIPLFIQNKSSNGISEISPLNLALQIDTMQVEGQTISFDIQNLLNRPFIPDGMQVINYTIKAGNTIVMNFYYEQKSIRKLFFQEDRMKVKRLDVL